MGRPLNRSPAWGGGGPRLEDGGREKYDTGFPCGSGWGRLGPRQGLAWPSVLPLSCRGDLAPSSTSPQWGVRHYGGGSKVEVAKPGNLSQPCGTQKTVPGAWRRVAVRSERSALQSVCVVGGDGYRGRG